MTKINKLTKIFDDYLVDNNRSFIGLKTACELVRNSEDEDIKNLDIEKMLMNGEIPNSQRINTTKPQWRIFLSKKRATQVFGDADEETKIIYNKKTQCFSTSKNKEKSIGKNGIIAICCTLMLLFFMWKMSNNNNTVEKKSYQYSNTETEDSQNMIDEDFSNKIFTFVSKSNDKEYINGGKLIQTNNETTYHQFDFVNKVVVSKSPINGKYITIKYPIIGFYKEKGTVATTYVVKVNDLGVKEIWFSPQVPNLGYDYDDGTRIACYDLEIIKD